MRFVLSFFPLVVHVSSIETFIFEIITLLFTGNASLSLPPEAFV